VRVEPVELRPVVERAAVDLAPLVAGRGIVLQVDMAENLVVQGNANALRQIVLNLLDNGARYGPDRQTITVGAAARDGQVDLWVEDRGPGVPAADRRRVWNAFVRLDRDRDSVVTGTGLGLTVVRELVEAQGGGCWIEEAAGQGARVVVRLAKGAAPA
jgi:two-component system phosphate regulon sensor histidine kinase PhoR